MDQLQATARRNHRDQEPPQPASEPTQNTDVDTESTGSPSALTVQSETFHFPKGATLPDEVKPDVIAEMLAQGVIEEVDK